MPEKPWEEQRWDYTTVAWAGLQWFLPDTLPQTARNRNDAQGTVVIWLQPTTAPAANCYCSSRDKPSSAINPSWPGDKVSLLCSPNHPKSTWRPSAGHPWGPGPYPAARLHTDFQSPIIFFAWDNMPQHGLWYFSSLGMCLCTPNQQELIAKHQCPFKTILQLLLSYHCPNLGNVP